MSPLTRNVRSSPRRSTGGFTLVELLIVISIVGLLVAAFLPDILGAKESANEAATQTNMIRLSHGCESFERKHGHYPPADLEDPEGKLEFKADNGVNTGIESLIAFVSQSTADGADLSDLAQRLVNTDNDKFGRPLPLLSRSDRVELADEWGVPMVYWSKVSGFDDEQQVAMPGGGNRVGVRARKNSEGIALGGRKFQLLSAGQDNLFGTADDLSFPSP